MSNEAELQALQERRLHASSVTCGELRFASSVKSLSCCALASQGGDCSALLFLPEQARCVNSSQRVSAPCVLTAGPCFLPQPAEQLTGARARFIVP